MGAARVDALTLDPAGQASPGARRSDGELVSAYLDGDRRAFSVLYERHHSRLFAFCRQRVKAHQCAEDIAHEVMTRALTYLDGFDRDRPMWPWLKMIARNQLVDHYRSTSRQVDVTDDALSEVDPSASEHTVWLAERDALVQAMEGLSPRDRNVLTLRYVSDWDTEELEREFGVERPTLYKLLQRARDRLHAAYEELAESSLGIALVPLSLRSLRSWFERLRGRLTGVEQTLLAGPASTELITYSLAVLVLAAGLGAAQPGSAEGAVHSPPPGDVSVSSPDASTNDRSPLPTDQLRLGAQFMAGTTADPTGTTLADGDGGSTVSVSTASGDRAAPVSVEGKVSFEDGSERDERTVNDRVEASIGEEGPWEGEGVATVYCTGSMVNRTACAVYDEADEEAVNGQPE